MVNVKVYFFASTREQTGQTVIEATLQDDNSTTTALMAQLVVKYAQKV